MELSVPEISDFNVRYLKSIDDAASILQKISATQPFLQLDFWQALEQQHAIGAKSGWIVSHILVEQAGQAVAFLPVFIKSHHRGEYIFDHSWADAYARHSLNYYPRLVTSVPFTPVTGQRLLLAEGYSFAQIWPVVFEAVQQLASVHSASSWHALFIDNELLEFLQQSLANDQHNNHSTSDQNSIPNIAIRAHCQFLWTNQNYQQFDDFLNELTAKKRKSIRVERQKIADQQISCAQIEGADISSDDIAFFYQCYSNTYFERGQKPYLTEAFFTQLVRDMPQHLMLITAYATAPDQQRPLAAALFFKDEQTLYGRYWGALEAVSCLHFEVCYYQGIDYAIKHNLTYFDPGTQGEHKLIRGFAPVYTHSVHWLAQPDFMHAVQQFCVQEKQHTEAYFQAALASTPYKQKL